MTAATRAAGDAKFTSFVGWSSNYRIDWLRLDLIAGLTVVAVVIPQAMAYATIAGLPVEAGLYTALVPILVYALLGTLLASVVPDGDGSLGIPKQGERCP
jgi:MFS superfamily sulfate permease-like transporter